MNMSGSRLARAQRAVLLIDLLFFLVDAAAALYLGHLTAVSPRSPDAAHVVGHPSHGQTFYITPAQDRLHRSIHWTGIGGFLACFVALAILSFLDPERRVPRRPDAAAGGD